MCNPTLIFSAARTAFSIVQANQQAKADRLQAQRQNEIAAQARREKENAENLRIRQIREKKLAKVAKPRNKITGADFKKLRGNKKKK